MKKISRFVISGLFGSRDVDIKFSDNKLILVGPNGIGKSSIINIFYLFLSRQWGRLLEYDFDDLSIHIGGEVLSAKREEILALSAYKRASGEITQSSRDISLSSRVASMISQLSEAEELEPFLAAKTLSLPTRKRVSNILNIPSAEVSSFHRYLKRKYSPEVDLFGLPDGIQIDNFLAQNLDGRILYLPTYRRIEKDIRDIFPDFEERFRQYAGGTSSRTPRAGRSAGHYVELVSFGMEDVRANLDAKLQDIKNYSLSQYNNLSAIYLRDVIQGKADQFIAEDIDLLTDEDVSDILARVSEETLSNDDKELLRAKVKNIQGRSRENIDVNDKYLAHYFSRLVSVRADIGRKEKDIRSFVDVCNKYLLPSKCMYYDEINSLVNIIDNYGKILDLSVLSSGEKQIVSIFAHLYLEDVDNQVIVIDEPELSLSVPWQKQFLPDIAECGRCSFLLAVTHSPFIYENSLMSNAMDLRRMTTVDDQ